MRQLARRAGAGSDSSARRRLGKAQCLKPIVRIDALYLADEQIDMRFGKSGGQLRTRPGQVENIVGDGSDCPAR